MILKRVEAAGPHVLRSLLAQVGESPSSEEARDLTSLGGAREMQRCRGLCPTACPSPVASLCSRPLFLAALWRHLSHLAGTQLSCDQNCFGGGRPTSIKNCERRINIILLLDAPGLVKPWEREEGRVVERMFCCYCSSDSLCKLITLPT